MGLMAVVSAHDMHLLDERGMFTRLERMVNSIEKLEKWHGHPFNWYNLRDLSLLRPRFISTVDSGNLFACLITTACALAECAGQAEKTSAEFAEELKKLAQLQKIWALRKPVLDAHILSLQEKVQKLEMEVDEIVMEKMSCRS